MTIISLNYLPLPDVVQTIISDCLPNPRYDFLFSQQARFAICQKPIDPCYMDPRFDYFLESSLEPQNPKENWTITVDRRSKVRELIRKVEEFAMQVGIFSNNTEVDVEKLQDLADKALLQFVYVAYNKSITEIGLQEMQLDTLFGSNRIRFQRYLENSKIYDRNQILFSLFDLLCWGKEVFFREISEIPKNLIPLPESCLSIRTFCWVHLFCPIFGQVLAQVRPIILSALQAHLLPPTTAVSHLEVGERRNATAAGLEELRSPSSEKKVKKDEPPK